MRSMRIHLLAAGAGEEKLAFLYFSRETGQTWKPDAAPGVSEDGAAMWLPNNVLVELLMTDEVCPCQMSTKISFIILT